MKYLMLILLSLTAWAEEETVSVASPHWEILGKRLKFQDREIDQFTGIPYAEPPVGDLRFKKPQPLKEFPKRVEAFHQPPSCHQVPIGIEKYVKNFFYKVAEEKKEDCLYLNIWRPVDKDTSAGNKAVMIWVYGGSFLIGSTGFPFYSGLALAGLGDVIVVTLNYRLGSFGLLSAGTEEEPGNLVLYDQQQAFKWVKDNIHHFGGDPSRITIFGESAGGISIAAHVTAPSSKGLFKRAIVQSGTTLMPELVSSKEAVIAKSEKIAKNAGCVKDGGSLRSHSDQIMTCLRSKSPKEILDAEFQLLDAPDDYEQLSIIYDEKYLDYKSLYPFYPSKVNKVQIMIGVTKDEAGSLFPLFASQIYVKDFKWKREKVEEIAKRFMTDFSNERMKDKVLQYYLHEIDESNSTDLDIAATKVMTDLLFTCPSQHFVDNERFKDRDIYFYRYTHHNSIKFPLRKENWKGAFHFEEVYYVFGVPLMTPQIPFTDMERAFSRDIIALWTSFAKYGHPQSPRHYYWPRYTPESPQVLDLNSDGAKVYPLPETKVCRKIWKSFFNPEGHCHAKDSNDNCI